MDIECANTLKDLIESKSSKSVLDLSEATLADRGAAMFLAICKLKAVGSPKNGRTLRRSIGDAVHHGALDSSQPLGIERIWIGNRDKKPN